MAGENVSIGAYGVNCPVSNLSSERSAHGVESVYPFSEFGSVAGGRDGVDLSFPVDSDMLRIMVEDGSEHSC